MHILDMALSHLIDSPGTLKNVVYPFIAITPKSTNLEW